MEKHPYDQFIGLIVKENGVLQIKPLNRKGDSARYAIKPEDLNGAKEDDVVVVELSAIPNKLKDDQATEVVRILGNKNSPHILSLLSLYERDLSAEFSAAAQKEAQNLSVPDLTDREDLRSIPLVTIDGDHSRDFDDAVFAEPTADGGFHLVVAIADVAWYVRPGSALDRDAQQKGNSVYFPDMVAPMLPEELSNGLCSLKPHEDRACLAFHMWIDKDGNLTNKKIVRGLMNSAARLTYKQVQAAKDGRPDAAIAPLMGKVVEPLYAAYEVLSEARRRRGALEVDQEDGRGDSEKVIEEFMVLANVAAATALEEKSAPCVYRVHGKPPSADRMKSLRALLAEHGLALPEGEIDRASAFNEVAAKAAALEDGKKITNAILRVQAKAVYDTHNIGHFGLALEKYAHFTSPIRRYADLLVHRSLISAFGLGEGGLSKAQKQDLLQHVSSEKIRSSPEAFDYTCDIVNQINDLERQSTEAERAAKDRLAVQALSSSCGQQMTGRIAGMNSKGLFVKLENCRVDGFVPMHFLPHDTYAMDQQRKTLTGRDHGRVFCIGDNIRVRIKKADALTASILLSPVNDNDRPQQKPAKGYSGTAAKQGDHKHPKHKRHHR